MPQVIQINQQPIATGTPVDHPRVQVLASTTYW